MVSRCLPQQLLHQLARGNAPLGGQRGELVADGVENLQVPTDGFALRIGGKCSDLHRCLHWWMIEAINDGLNQVAET